MKLYFAKAAYDQLDEASRSRLVPVACTCVATGKVDCDSCDGSKVVYEDALTPEESAAIEENLRRQGVPIGKTGTN